MPNVGAVRVQLLLNYLQRETKIRVEPIMQRDHLAFMATLIDMSSDRVRHPEKAHKPDTEVLRKPKWIRVKAPTSKGYAETRKIVKDKGLVTV